MNPLTDGKPGHLVGVHDLYGRHAYVDYRDPVAAVQRRVNKARGEGREPAERDLAEIAGWFDARETGQLVLPFGDVA